MTMKYFLPDRYEAIQRNKKENANFIKKVKKSIRKINELIDIVESNGRGSFLLLRGTSGSGKTTFINTLSKFTNENFEVVTIGGSVDLQSALENMCSSNGFRLIIIEDRENVEDISAKSIVSSLQCITKYIRSDAGSKSIVVWPFNELGDINDFVYTAQKIGGSSLLDEDENYHDFEGLPKDEYYDILLDTFEFYNENKSLEDFGITHDVALEICNYSLSMGDYLTNINTQIRKNKKQIANHFNRVNEFSLWVLVIAGNEVHKDVGILTKGNKMRVDINRLFEYSPTSNVTTKYKENPYFGLFCNAIDCRIIDMSKKSALEYVCNENISEKLKEKLNLNDIKYSSTSQSIANRIDDEPLVKCLKGKKSTSNGTRGLSDSNNADFEKLTAIAVKDDKILNVEIARIIGEYLEFDKTNTEIAFSGVENRVTDIVFENSGHEHRIEIMWRRESSVGEIANYTLKKIKNYGEVMGVL